MIPKTIQQKLDEGRQYRRMAEFRADEGEGMMVTGYATTFNEPYELYSFDNYTVREQIDPAAFAETDMSDVIMQYNHEGRVFARNSNGTLALSTDNHGLHIAADLSGTEIGRQLYEEIRGGYTDKMSFGFTVDKDEQLITETEDGKVDILRTIKSIRKLYDVSAVSLPANNATEISARAYGEGVIAEAAEEIRKKQEKIRQAKRIKVLSNI